MAAVTTRSAFGAQETELCHRFYFSLILMWSGLLWASFIIWIKAMIIVMVQVYKYDQYVLY